MNLQNVVNFKYINVNKNFKNLYIHQKENKLFEILNP
jgi:hypothetical protein